MPDPYWNDNLHCQRLVLDAIHAAGRHDLPTHTFRRTDHLDGHLPPGAYDLISAVAVVHHTDHRQAFGARSGAPRG
jgi:hypothetical protein